MPPPLPPYALPAPVFTFRHLATLAGRAPIGGAREVAMACFVAARMASEGHSWGDEDPSPRLARAAGAKAWLATLALPAAVRAPLSRCIELSAEGSQGAMGREILLLAQASASFLDSSAAGELERLAATLLG